MTISGNRTGATTRQREESLAEVIDLFIALPTLTGRLASSLHIGHMPMPGVD